MAAKSGGVVTTARPCRESARRSLMRSCSCRRWWDQQSGLTGSFVAFESGAFRGGRVSPEAGVEAGKVERVVVADFGGDALLLPLRRLNHVPGMPHS